MSLTASFGSLRRELQTLDWRRPERWTPSMRRLLAASASLLLLIVLTQGLLMPHVQQWRDLRDQQHQAQQALSDLQQILAPLRQQAQQQTALRDLHRQLWPYAEDDWELLRILATLRERHGLFDEGYEPLQASDFGDYRRVQLRLQLRGSYHALAGFLSDVAALKQMLVIEQVELKLAEATAAEAAPTLNIALRLCAYRLRETLPAEDPQ